MALSTQPLSALDLLAIDEVGNFYVFELKRGRTPDYTMGQLMRYMGWVSQTIGKNRSVQGLSWPSKSARRCVIRSTSYPM
ncbi:RecB family endonuclease NucS [Lysobacter niabensis]|uniref:RecB family endonuclease NucS n=1 Tax=Agrilutibacter niabensis TaxID=380628 RepID=A0ABU1VK18_9GAMM|nr:RecB family endonuclease NucS [Lysobacter niabensis]